MIFITYKLTNKINGHYYYGKTNMRNWQERTYLGSGYKMVEAVEQFGRKAFTRQVIACFADEEQAYADEARLVTMKEVNDPKCYNERVGGGGFRSGEKHPMYGKPHSESHKRNLSIALSGPNNPNYGITLPRELVKIRCTRANITKALKKNETDKMLEEQEKQWAKDNPELAQMAYDLQSKNMTAHQQRKHNGLKVKQAARLVQAKIKAGTMNITNTKQWHRNPMTGQTIVCVPRNAPKGFVVGRV